MTLESKVTRTSDVYFYLKDVTSLIISVDDSFTDLTGSLGLIGCSQNFVTDHYENVSCFTGYLYSMEIFNVALNYDGLVEKLNGKGYTFTPDCEYNEYLDTTCQSCTESCEGDQCTRNVDACSI